MGAQSTAGGTVRLGKGYDTEVKMLSDGDTYTTMNNDGWGFLGAGDSDMRVAGRDLQHNRQKRTGESANHSTPVSQIEVHEALMNEVNRHKEGKKLRLEHLAKHYKR